jgi:hypothetical protein
LDTLVQLTHLPQTIFNIGLEGINRAIGVPQMFVQIGLPDLSQDGMPGSLTDLNDFVCHSQLKEVTRIHGKVGQGDGSRLLALQNRIVDGQSGLDDSVLIKAKGFDLGPHEALGDCQEGVCRSEALHVLQRLHRDKDRTT